MDQIFLDPYIICYICDFMKDYTKLMFLSINTKNNMLKKNVLWISQRKIEQIRHLSYYNNFKKIIAVDDDIIPKNTNKLILYIKNKFPYVPASITHLTLEFNRSYTLY